MRPDARIFAAALPFLMGAAWLQSANRAVEDGNAALKAGKPEDALKCYEAALKQHPANPAAHFDRGTALFALSRYPEAAEEFLRATEGNEPALKAVAFYNLGNSFFKADKFAEAAEAFRRALTIDPADPRAKWNLELALQKKKQEDEKKKKDENQDKDKKNDKKQDDKQKKPDKQQDKQDEKKQPEQPKPPEPQKQQEQQQPPPADSKDIDAVLDSLEKSPRSLEQERARLRAVRRAAPTKDW